MTAEEFNIFWNLYFPATVPISYRFKRDYPDRWFRIHSLPESQRYAEDDIDWKIILSRQNEIITDLFGHDTPIFLVTGEFNIGYIKVEHVTDEEEVYGNYSFTKFDNIDLHEIEPEQYDKVDIYRPAFAQTFWKLNYHDNLLKEIANDNCRAFFVSFDKNVIIAPYDGGVDFVLKDSLTKEFYKNKYKQWLSKREDGL